MNTKYDAIIIGSGLGGLAASATLSIAKKKVLVLEQHNIIGGCATCFKRKGMYVDAGLHEMDFGLPQYDMKHAIFKHLGLDKRIELITLPSAWSIIEQNNPNKILTIPHGHTKEALKEAFPHEKEGIMKYFKKIKFQGFLVRRFPFEMKFLDFFFAPFTTLIFFAYNMIRNKSVGEVLDSCIKDSKLKRILNINITYYHHNPYKFIFSYHAIAQNNYYNKGVYIKGGSQKLSDSLSEIIIENGGEVRANADVIKILLDVDGKSAKGVKYIDKKSKEEIEVYADTIIANCDPHIVYTKLLSDLTPSKYQKDLNLTSKFRLTSSLVSLYMIFDKNLSEIYPNMDYATFIVDEKYFNLPFDKDNADVANTPIENRDFAFINYSKIDNGLSNRDDRHLAVGAIYSCYEEWELDKESYKTKKQKLQEALIKRLETIYPKIMDHCIHIELATPKTIERYTRTRKGVIYGYDQDNEGFIGRERFKSKSISNLYFASSFGFPGGGFTGAILSGYRTAKKILDPYFYAKRITLCVIFGSIIGVCVSLALI